MPRTLADILDTMPETGWKRYSEAFWVAKANFVLNEIETMLTGPLLSIEVAVPLVEGVTQYEIPKEIRKLQKVRLPTTGSLGIDDDDPSARVPHIIVGRQFRLREMLVLDGSTDIECMQDLTNDDPRNSNIVVDTSALLNIPDPTGKAAIIQHLEGGVVPVSIETAIIAKAYNAPFEPGIMLNGKIKEKIQLQDLVTITSNFLICEGRCYLTPFKTLDSESPLPAEWDRALAKGLRFYLEFQQDEDATVRLSESHALFKEDLELIECDYTQFDGDAYPIRPRSQAMFRGMRRRS